MKYRISKNIIGIKFIQKLKKTKKPNSFAKFCLKKYIKNQKNKRLLDIRSVEMEEYNLFFPKKLIQPELINQMLLLNFYKINIQLRKEYLF